MDLVPWPSSEYEAEVDLVLIQTSLALSWKFSSKNTYQHKKNLIYIIFKSRKVCIKTRLTPASLPSISVIALRMQCGSCTLSIAEVQRGMGRVSWGGRIFLFWRLHSLCAAEIQ